VAVKRTEPIKFCGVLVMKLEKTQLRGPKGIAHWGKKGGNLSVRRKERGAGGGRGVWGANR